MRRLTIPIVLATALFVGCAAHHKPTRATLKDLHNVRPDVQEAKVDEGLDQALQGYRRFLEETPETAMTPEAMRRLADLKLEQQFGIHGGDGKPKEMAAPQSSKPLAAPPAAPTTPSTNPDTIDVVSGPVLRESDEDFEQRTTL